MKNEFDELLQQQFEKGEFEYSSTQWDRMAAALATEEKPASKKRIWFWLPALALAASLSLFLILTVNTNSDEQVITKTATSNSTKTGTETNSNPATSTDPIATQPLPQIAISNTTTIPLNVASTNRAVLRKDAIAITKQPVLNSSNTDINKVNTPVTPKAENKTEQQQQIDLAKKDPNDLRHINLGDPELFERKTIAKTSLALAGGVNYGSMNTGYAVGVTARRQVYGQFYVESDVALVNNATAFSGTSTSTTTIPAGTASTMSAFDVKNSGFTTVGTSNSGQPLSLGSPAGEETKRTVTTTTSTPGNLFYLQVTPSVGYRVSRTVALSVGADVQRLLNDNNDDDKPTMAFAANNEQKQVAGLDFGLMGKTEVSLNKNLKAGLQYRKAMNDVVNSSNKYLDRSYMQVQLKFIILNK